MYLLLNAFTVAGEDYTAIMAMFTVNQMSPSTTKRVEILDNDDRDGNKNFFLRIQGECGVDVWVEICIWDDESSMFSLTLALNHSEDIMPLLYY